MDSKWDEVSKYLIDVKDDFEEHLLKEAVNVRDKIEEIQEIGNINLLENAHTLVLYVTQQDKTSLEAFAEKEGEIWAGHSLTLSLKLEWIQAIRRTLWMFFEKFDRFYNIDITKSDFYELEKRVNVQVDYFLNRFFLSFSEYKDKLLTKQKELVRNLSVPIIPLTSSMSVLPLIGDINSDRLAVIGEKVLQEVSDKRIQTLIIDLSGVAKIEADLLPQLFKTIDGVDMMGCKTEITGMKPDMVLDMIKKGISFENKIETKGTLQQTIKEYINPHVH